MAQFLVHDTYVFFSTEVTGWYLRQNKRVLYPDLPCSKPRLSPDPTTQGTLRKESQTLKQQNVIRHLFPSAGTRATTSSSGQTRVKLRPCPLSARGLVLYSFPIQEIKRREITNQYDCYRTTSKEKVLSPFARKLPEGLFLPELKKWKAASQPFQERERN